MRWFTSDLHLNHTNVITYCDRPWADVEDMNAGLLDRWNSVVRPDDHVTILGDLTLKNPAPNGVPAPWLAEWLAAANGTKTLYIGNHDKAWHPRTREKAIAAYHELGIAHVHLHGTTTFGAQQVAGQIVGLSHLPRTVTAHEQVSEREYRSSIPFPDDETIWRLHGHVHRQWLQHGPEINVGVDAWNGRPVSEVTIAAMMYLGRSDVPAYPWEA